MQRGVTIAAIAGFAAMAVASGAWASQGPGVGPGNAGAAAQLAAAAILAAIVAFVAYGLVKALLGRGPGPY
jgi:hypothetical protein